MSATLNVFNTYFQLFSETNQSLPVGYGDIVPTNILEMTYSTVIILFGGLLLPAVVGGLAAYMSNFRYAAKQFRKNFSKTRTHLKDQLMVDVDSVEHISRFYHYSWNRRACVEDEDVMDELSTPLRLSVASFINGEAIASIPFFSRCNDSTRQLMVSSLQQRQFIPSDLIIKEGSVSTNEMFFLHQGQAIAILDQMSYVPYRILRPGDYFGESGLISSTNFETIKTETYCECFALSRADFEEALEGSTVGKKIKADIANALLRSTMLGKRVMHNISNHSKCSRLVFEMSLSKHRAVSGGKSQTLLLPTSPYYLLWNCFLFMACIYNVWMIPFRLAFVASTDSSSSLLALDWIFDIFFILDMYVNYRFVGFVQDGGEIITEVEKIKRNYMLKRFKMDVISSFPFDLITFLIPLRAVSLTTGLGIGDLLRLLKLLRFPRYFHVIEKVFSVLQDRRIPLAPLRLVEFFGGVILIAHFAACGFFAFARWNKGSEIYCTDTEFEGCEWHGTWIYRQIFNGKLPVDGGEAWQQYIRSFNWALPTLVVVVIGDVVRTKLFNLLSIHYF